MIEKFSYKIYRNKCVCRTSPQIIKDDIYYIIRCPKCGNVSPKSKWLYKSIIAWNKSKHSIKPHWTFIKELKKFDDKELAKQWLYFKILDVNEKLELFKRNKKRFNKKSVYRTKLNFLKEYYSYLLFLLDYHS